MRYSVIFFCNIERNIYELTYFVFKPEQVPERKNWKFQILEFIIDRWLKMCYRMLLYESYTKVLVWFHKLRVNSQ